MTKLSWTWKKTPEGYEASGAPFKAVLHKKGKAWVLTVDGKDHEIKSRRPSFDHAEGLLRQLGKTAYDYDRRFPA